MDRYIIESIHTEETCTLLLDEVSAMGYLHNFEWGCDDGVHCGWAIIEADSQEQALMVVPSLARDTARAIRLVKFSPEMVRALHKD